MIQRRSFVVDSTLLEVLHPRQVPQSAGFEGAAWVRWGSFSVYGLKLHLICSVNRVPVSYELTSANTPEVLLVEELLEEPMLEGATARKLFGDLAYHSSALGKELAERNVLLATEGAERMPALRQQVEVCFAALKRVFGIDDTLAKTLVGLATRILRRRLPPTPTVATSTVSWDERRDTSRSSVGMKSSQLSSSAWNRNSPKFISKIVHSPAPIPLQSPLQVPRSAPPH